MKIQSNGASINVEVEGPDNRPVLMLSNSLGADLRMWDRQVQRFTEHFRLVRYDRRGHGQSDAPPGPYSMEMLGRDVLAVLDALRIDRINWCGLSMGGMVGMWLGANAPERINKLILSNTTAHFADTTPWFDRIKLVREKGLGALVGPTMERWFTKEFREREPRTIATMSQQFLATPAQGYIGCCEAIAAMDHRDLLPRITAPTLVIAGRQDPATNVEAAEAIRSRIPGALITVLDAAHISNVEQPDEYANQVLGFLLLK